VGTDPAAFSHRDRIIPAFSASGFLGIRSTSAGEEGNILCNITIVPHLYGSIAVDGKISAKPAVAACNELCRAVNGAHYFCSLSQRVPDGIQQFPFQFKKIGAVTKMIDHEHNQHVLHCFQLHIPYQLSFLFSVLLQGAIQILFFRLSVQQLP
jgi:hypothetical protein